MNEEGIVFVCNIILLFFLNLSSFILTVLIEISIFLNYDSFLSDSSSREMIMRN